MGWHGIGNDATMTDLHVHPVESERDRVVRSSGPAVPSPADRCPACGTTPFDPQETAGETRFCCQGCGSTWRYVLGMLWPLDA